MTWLIDAAQASDRLAIAGRAGRRGAAVRVHHFFREEPAPYFASDEEHFLFGSVGTESRQGVPYWIWLVLPRIFPEHLPGTRRLRVARRARDATVTRCRSACRR